MKLEKVTIPSGKVTLAGLLYVPQTPPRATALLFAHGFTSGKHSLDGLANYMAHHGYLGLTFDFIGHKLGGSGGSMDTVSQAVQNLRDALDWLHGHSQAQRIVLVGHSMGGVVALQVAAQERRALDEADTEDDAAPRLAGVVCLCVGGQPSKGFESPVGRAMLTQYSDYVAGASAQQLVHELDTLVQAAAEIGDTPALFVAARQDVLVPVAKVEEIAAHGGPTASCAVIESSHLEAPNHARGALAKWLESQGLT